MPCVEQGPSRAERSSARGHILWLHGASGAGQAALAHATHLELAARQIPAIVLDEGRGGGRETFPPQAAARGEAARPHAARVSGASDRSGVRGGSGEGLRDDRKDRAGAIRLARSFAESGLVVIVVSERTAGAAWRADGEAVRMGELLSIHVQGSPAPSSGCPLAWTAGPDGLDVDLSRAPIGACAVALMRLLQSRGWLPGRGLLFDEGPNPTAAWPQDRRRVPHGGRR